MNDQTFLPSVSTLLSKDSVPVAVVTSVLDFVPFPKNVHFPKNDVNPKSWTQQKREVYRYVAFPKNRTMSTETKTIHV